VTGSPGWLMSPCDKKFQSIDRGAEGDLTGGTWNSGKYQGLGSFTKGTSKNVFGDFKFSLVGCLIKGEPEGRGGFH